MHQTFYPLLSLLMHLLLPRHNAQIQFLLAQIRILRARIDSDRIVPTPEEKAELLLEGTLLENNFSEFL